MRKMKKNILTIVCMLFACMSFGQTPASTNVLGAQYPAVYPDNRVEFRIKAPEALKVQADFDGKKYDMEKDAEGVWSVISEVATEGIHYYSLVIDGVSVVDPGSETFFGCGRMMSCVEIPYPDGGEQYQIQDVPHGQVRTCIYYSKAAKAFRQMYVYTPAGYDKNVNQKYPVLYIMHGGGEDARGWILQGRGNTILDNLIAAGKSVPMIMVSLDANLGRDYDLIASEIVDNVVPFVESEFRVDARAEKRALAGLSMGGMYTLHTGVPRSDMFNYLGVFSSGWWAGNTGFYNIGKEADACYDYLKNNQKKFNKNMKLFWISQGSPTDIAYNNCKIMMKRFDEMSINYKYYESKEGGHTWPVWREDLYLFAPQLFK